MLHPRVDSMAPSNAVVVSNQRKVQRRQAIELRELYITVEFSVVVDQGRSRFMAEVD